MFYKHDKVSTRTHALMRNIAYLCKQNRIERMARIRSLSASLATATRISSCTLSTITALGNYRDGIATQIRSSPQTGFRVYEYTAVSITESNKIGDQENDIGYAQIMFFSRRRNRIKISPNRWFRPILRLNHCAVRPFRRWHEVWPPARSITSGVRGLLEVGGTRGEVVAFKGRWGMRCPTFIVSPIPR
ncbi:hypothetical protein EI94DRAFT_1619764 [Lactarius quietus]|nr:hypothetical protein EI94DRAFT_1619764 [Lactarius quietus]